ncbi:MAG: hypothetical protein MR549_03350 [Lachnobacterium sp.]|nr:hypothetical protein [Lachnobacterium sp.]
MEKILDYAVLAILVVGLIVLCFFQECSHDIYFLIFGFVVAAVSVVAMIIQNRKKKDSEQNK